MPMECIRPRGVEESAAPADRMETRASRCDIRTCPRGAASDQFIRARGFGAAGRGRRCFGAAGTARPNAGFAADQRCDLGGGSLGQWRSVDRRRVDCARRKYVGGSANPAEYRSNARRLGAASCRSEIASGGTHRHRAVARVVVRKGLDLRSWRRRRSLRRVRYSGWIAEGIVDVEESARMRRLDRPVRRGSPMW